MTAHPSVAWRPEGSGPWLCVTASRRFCPFEDEICNGSCAAAGTPGFSPSAAGILKPLLPKPRSQPTASQIRRPFFLLFPHSPPVWLARYLLWQQKKAHENCSHGPRPCRHARLGVTRQAANRKKITAKSPAGSPTRHSARTWRAPPCRHGNRPADCGWS